MTELEGNEVSINVWNFGGASVLLKVGKKTGMERVQLLADDDIATDKDKQAAGDAPGGLWNTLSK